ncbi:hypothetical protein Tco_0616200 [Tanacetum coccineum]
MDKSDCEDQIGQGCLVNFQISKKESSDKAMRNLQAIIQYKAQICFGQSTKDNHWSDQREDCFENQENVLIALWKRRPIDPVGDIHEKQSQLLKIYERRNSNRGDEINPLQINVTIKYKIKDPILEIAENYKEGRHSQRQFKPVIDRLKQQGYIGEEPLKQWKMDMMVVYGRMERKLVKWKRAKDEIQEVQIRICALKMASQFLTQSQSIIDAEIRQHREIEDLLPFDKQESLVKNEL